MPSDEFIKEFEKEWGVGTPNKKRWEARYGEKAKAKAKIKRIAEQKAQEYLGRSLRFDSDQDLINIIISAIKLVNT